MESQFLLDKAHVQNQCMVIALYGGRGRNMLEIAGEKLYDFHKNIQGRMAQYD